MNKNEINLFIYQSELEFKQLFERLGYDSTSIPVHMKIFNLTNSLANYAREMQQLWETKFQPNSPPELPAERIKMRTLAVGDQIENLSKGSKIIERG